MPSLHPHEPHSVETRWSLPGRIFIVVETFACFAVPVQMLAFGVIMSPMLLMGALSGVDGSGYLVIYTLTIVGGCLGSTAIFLLVRYLVARKARVLPWRLVLPSTAAGIASSWTTATGQFHALDFSWMLIVLAIAPSLCSIHLVWLAARKSRKELGLIEGAE